MCHRFEMVSGEEADAVLDWLRAVRRALASGAGAATVVPPAFGRPVDVPFDALDCYPGAESSGIVMEEGDLARVDLLWGVDVSWKRGLVFNARIERAGDAGGMWSGATPSKAAVASCPFGPFTKRGMSKTLHQLARGRRWSRMRRLELVILPS